MLFIQQGLNRKYYKAIAGRVGLKGSILSFIKRDEIIEFKETLPASKIVLNHADAVTLLFPHAAVNHKLNDAKMLLKDLFVEWNKQPGRESDTTKSQKLVDKLKV